MNKTVPMFLSAVLISLLLSVNTFAEKFSPEMLVITDAASGEKAPEVADNDLATGRENSGKGLLVDLGKETMIHRIYISPGADAKDQIKSVKISFLQKPDDAIPSSLSFIMPACEWFKVREERMKILKTGEGDLLPAQASHVKSEPKTDADMKFNPVKARFLKIEGPAKIAEIEIYGSADPAAFEKKEAVVLPADAPELLRLAAEDLRYYIGELSGRPIPIIAPGQEEKYPGALYVVADLKPLAKTYGEMEANRKSGAIPTDSVNVEKEGRKIIFKAWPYANVLHSVWEFLRRQGVVWAYPGNHGDFVPSGKGVDQDILPLKYSPSAKRRYANFAIMDSGLYPYTDAFLYFARNGYGVSWGELQQFWNLHKETPPDPSAATRKKDEVKPEFTEGFDGYPHNFANVIPDRILEQHPDWCGMNADGKRLPPNKGGPSTFCMTSPGAIQFVSDKILDWVGPNTEYRARFNLLPMDGCRYCQCPDCKTMYEPHEPTTIPWVPGMPYMVSDAYYYFVSEVAKLVAPKAPNVQIFALAYADVLAPPRKIDRLPDNVLVEVCQYGSRNLPMSSPANEGMRQYMEAWAKKCKKLEDYEYQLIEGEWMELPMPLPSVAAICDRSKLLHKLGAWNGGSQSGTHCLPHNPWNHYAFARMLWNVDQTSDQILNEFFPAYYQEAAVPMLEYYRTFEKHVLSNNIDFQTFGYDQGPNPDAFPPEIVASMQKALDEAKKAAKSWFVKQRVEQAQKDLDWSIPASMRRSPDKALALKYGKKEYACTRANSAITIDGRLDEDAWKSAPVSAGFIKPKTHEPVPDEIQSEFRMLRDEDNLFIAVKCRNPKISELKETDAIWGGSTDSVELFLVPQKSYTAAYYQTAVSAFNRTMPPTRFNHDQFHKDTQWKGGEIKSATTRENGFWTCEIAIPFKMLAEGAPKNGDWWRFNIARNCPTAASSWSPLQFGAWALYRDFNFVTFAELR